MIKAFVFDFDGLILDTETLMYQATSEVYQEYGGQLPIEIWGKLAGTHDENFDLVENLKEQTKALVSRDTFYKKRDGLFNQYIEKASILPGVEALLEGGKREGLKIALATSSGDQWAKSHLERLGLLHYFDFVVEANDVKKVKPDPELFLKACEGVGVKPSEAIAFEDSYHGAVSAKKAGLYCVVVPNEVTKGLSFEDDVDLKLTSLDETSYEALQELFNT
jgi:HAD superfamily hydrolase (TIGR01509 family)